MRLIKIDHNTAYTVPKGTPKAIECYIGSTIAFGDKGLKHLVSGRDVRDLDDKATISLYPTLGA